MPIFASLLSLSRSVEDGTLPKRDSSFTVASGVAHSKSSVSSRARRRERRDGTGLATGLLASMRSTVVMAPCCRIQDLHPVAHGVQDGAGQHAARVAPSQEPPKGVAGHAEGLRRLSDAPPQNVGPQVLADGVLKVWVERCALARRPCL